MNKAIKTVLMLTAMLAAGCSESTVAPKSATLDSTIPGGGATAALTGTDTLRFSFVIDPNRSTSYYLGQGNTITFPAGSLCDPNRSSYGPTEWDKWCPAASSPVTVNTKAWLDAAGQPHLDFDRHVRFVPTWNPAGWVMLTLSDYGTGINLWSNISYCATEFASSCIDESKSDPTVATVNNPVTGKLTRRVKHFSGYSLTSGRDSDSDGYSFNKIGAGAVVKP
ncbi:MAG TPA: hypothetical protein VGM82_12680 [Gemmatimonadaceae bacterium]|jgi:hypothetical protein